MRSGFLRGLTTAVAAVGGVVAVDSCSRRSLIPQPGERTAAAPDSFRVAVETSRGRFDVVAHRGWAPNGVDRFYVLVRRQYYDDARFFRVVSGFVAQFGLSGDPRVTEAWRPRSIADEPVRQSNRRGRIAFARGGPNTRTTQLFINLRDNPRLDTLNGFGFPPIAEVVAGMEVVDSLYAGYGEGQPRGNGPPQDSIRALGNEYLRRAFPRLDFIQRARVVREWR
ncbi:MAG: peptidylprolyl isomerase [Gemmatimonadaceae bacterium]